MPYDPNLLPDLAATQETPEERLKRQLDELAAKLGDGFGWKGGLQYQNGGFTGRVNNKGLDFSYPVSGGLLKGSIRDIQDDPYYQLRYIKNFK